MLKKRLASAPPSLLRALHGDPHPANTVRVDGSWLFIDCDSMCAGPAEIDLAQVLAYDSRYQGEGTSSGLLDAYELSVDLGLLGTATAARRVKRLTWMAAMWADRPDVRPELLRMVDAFDGSSLSC